MRYLLCGVLLALSAAAARADEKPKPNSLTPKEIAEGWVLLFDGETTFGWPAGDEVKAEGGVLTLGGKKNTKLTLDLGFFELAWEYIAEGSPARSAKAVRDGKPVGGTQGGFSNVIREGKPVWIKERWLVEGDPRGGAGGGSEWKGDSATGMVVVTTSTLPAPARVTVELAIPAGSKLALRNVKLRPLGLRSIFNGKDLTGWKEFPGKKSKFTVTDKGELNVKDGPGDLQSEGKWGDFVLQFDCISNGKHLNSGLFFRCIPDQYQQGYEAQIRNEFTAEPREYTVDEYDPETHKLTGKKKVTSTAVDYGTGAIYRRVPARKQASKDGEWFTMTVIAQGNHLATWVNGIQQVDWTDNRPPADNARNGYRAEAGAISLQGHDPTTDLSFRNFRIAELPAPKR